MYPIALLSQNEKIIRMIVIRRELTVNNCLQVSNYMILINIYRTHSWDRVANINEENLQEKCYIME